jgi:hypothetical protein
MLWRVRNSRGRPLNVPAAFIHPCQPIVAKQPYEFPFSLHPLSEGQSGAILVQAEGVRLGVGSCNMARMADALVFLGIFLWLFVPFVNGPEPTGTETFWFLTKMLVWAAALIGVSYLTGEPPKWQWGIPEDSDKRE